MTFGKRVGIHGIPAFFPGASSHRCVRNKEIWALFMLFSGRLIVE